MRRRLVAASLLVVGAAALGLASASGLSVGSSSLGASGMTSPCSGTAVATAVGATDVQAGDPAYGGISVALPAGCSGARAVQVTLLAGSSSVVSGSGTVTGSANLSTSRYFAQTVTSGVATVDGWDLPVTWSFVPPATCQVAGGGSCVAAVTLWTGQRNGGSSSALYFDVWVTTTSTSWVSWTVTFDLSNAYYGTTVTRLGNSDLDPFSDGSQSWSQTGNVNDVHRTSACSSLPSLVVAGDANSGNNNRNFSLVRNDRPRYFSLVVNRTEAGYYDVLAPGC